MNPSPTPTPILIELINNDSGSIDWISTILPFATLALGAVLTYYFTGRSEKRKTDREDEQRWDIELLARGGKVLATLEILYRANAVYQGTVNDYLKDRQHSDNEAVMDTAAADARSALAGFATARTELTLIAPMDVVTAASVLGDKFQLVQAKAEIVPSTPVYPEPTSQTSFIRSIRDATGVPDFNKRKGTR